MTRANARRICPSARNWARLPSRGSHVASQAHRRQTTPTRPRSVENPSGSAPARRAIPSRGGAGAIGMPNARPRRSTNRRTQHAPGPSPPPDAAGQRMRRLSRYVVIATTRGDDQTGALRACVHREIPFVPFLTFSGETTLCQAADRQKKRQRNRQRSPTRLTGNRSDTTVRTRRPHHISRRHPRRSRRGLSQAVRRTIDHHPGQRHAHAHFVLARAIYPPRELVP